MGLGGLTGFLAGLLGIGGGIILVPCLYYIIRYLGMPHDEIMHTAIGTSHAVIVITAISSARSHWLHGAVRRDLLGIMGIGIVCGVGISTILAGHVGGHTLKVIFAIIVMGLAGVMLMNTDDFSVWKKAPGKPAHATAGFVIGTLAALMGIGGAILSVPYMTHARIPMRQAVGTRSEEHTSELQSH